MPYEEEIPPYVELPEPPAELDELAKKVIGAAIEVHRNLKSGLPEKSYEGALAVELTERGIPFERQKRVEIYYKGFLVGHGRIDLLVAGKLIVEVKSVDALGPVDRLQALGYMRIINQPLALIINFNVALLKDGIRRVVASL